MRVEFRVNGEAVELDVEPRRTLADALRDNLGLTGTHLGCEHGVCGACTVLVDGEPVRSCLMFAVQADATAVTNVVQRDRRPGQTAQDPASPHPPSLAAARNLDANPLDLDRARGCSLRQ